MHRPSVNVKGPIYSSSGNRQKFTITRSMGRKKLAALLCWWVVVLVVEEEEESSVTQTGLL